MPHPKQKHSYARTHKRRAHHALSSSEGSVCSHCQASLPPHTVCDQCGHYRGRDILNLDQKRSRKEERVAKRKLREQKEQEAMQQPAA